MFYQALCQAVQRSLICHIYLSAASVGWSPTHCVSLVAPEKHMVISVTSLQPSTAVLCVLGRPRNHILCLREVSWGCELKKSQPRSVCNHTGRNVDAMEVIQHRNTLPSLGGMSRDDC
ncbi:hypothetical protein BsWGS_13729 [Bradybaena similaris]